MNHISMDEATIAELRAQLKEAQVEVDKQTNLRIIVERERDAEMDTIQELLRTLRAMTDDRDVWATVARDMTEQRDIWQEVAGDMRRDANRLRAERNILLAALSPMPDAVRQKLDAIAEPK